MSGDQARDVILREEAFAPLLQEASQEFGGFVRAVQAQRALLTVGAAQARLYELSGELEMFLDDHGAKLNRRFAPVRELVASVRSLAGVMGVALHVRRRVQWFDLISDKALIEEALKQAIAILSEAMLSVLEQISEEGVSLGCRWETVAVAAVGPVEQRRLLPRNADAEEAVDEQQHVAEIAARFREALEGSRKLDLVAVRPREELTEFVALYATEERCRRYESAVHNIQSMYDTYIQHTRLEHEHPWLSQLRAQASVALHFLEMATGLVHFYERHENDIRHEAAQERISRIVDKETILHVAVNLCLRQAYQCVEAAAPLAERILEAFVSQGEVVLVMPEGITLHARPLALIVQVARQYGTPIELDIDGDNCSANSLMSLIMVAGEHPRPERITARGDARALRDLQALFSTGLGETDRKLPSSLGYLKTN